ncbi:sulfatase-like hydrolase/transferase [Adhaeribacter rhizoryzae]|uniref:Sulfatase-like hydrolase/transferase n=1 Tax=Adhaeribacter rhizoryzae TaxID=2607907 RepID=A0A5M6DNR6_9BACT|nr:sulfatase-like hydrolase/transferase [Adhaeribacter rhizoryzae]
MFAYPGDLVNGAIAGPRGHYRLSPARRIGAFANHAYYFPRNAAKHGYYTGIVGKWHLTGYAKAGAKEVGPSQHGFNETIISENEGIAWGSYFHPYHFNKEITQKLPGKEHLVDRTNAEALDFIQRHKEKPFFLYLSHYAVHTALAGKDELVKKYEQKPGSGKGALARENNPHLAAQLEAIDTGVGQIRQKLEELGLAQNTILVFTSDNGGESDWAKAVTTNAPLRGGKSTLYEGGIRVPLLVLWPGKVKGGSRSNVPVITTDFYPTLLEMAQLKPDPRQVLEGVSLVPLLRGTKAVLPRNTLYWHYPLKAKHFLGGTSAAAIRQNNWKLIQFYDTNQAELYNLQQDPGEMNNLATVNPAKTKALQTQLQQWQQKVGATK